jgi:hypothetical protein
MIQMTLEQDEQHDEELAKKRAISGAAGGKQKAANIRFATDSVANVANAINKNKNKSKNKNKEKVQEKEKLFERFWTAYPRKVAKQTAMRAFEKIDPDEAMLETMIAAIGKWKMTDQWNEAGGQFIPHPATWLNQRRWEDELPKPGKTKPTVIAQMYEQRDYSGVQAELMAMQDQEMADFLKN